MKLWIIFCLLGTTACRNTDSDPVFPVPNDLTQVPFRIKTVRQQTDYGDPKFRNQDNTAVYHYDSLGRVLRIERQWDDRDLEYQYQGSQLSTRLTRLRRDSSIVFRETFEYDSQGKLNRLNWSGNGSQYVRTFRYDTQGQIVEIRHEALNYVYVGLSNYRWENGNVVAMNEFDGAGKPQSEWTYGYDSAINPQALSPADPDGLVNRNNLIRTTLVRDYAGIIDLVANPLTVKHDYTPSGLPLRKYYNYSGRTETFAYEDRR